MKALTPRFPHLLHGGDYNPEQWLAYPDVLEKDIELMKKAHVNCVSLGIFAWSHLGAGRRRIRLFLAGNDHRAVV